MECNNKNIFICGGSDSYFEIQDDINFIEYYHNPKTLLFFMILGEVEVEFDEVILYHCLKILFSYNQ